MGLSRTVSEINGNFSRKSPIFPTPYILPSLKGFPVELSIGAWVQKPKMMGLYTGPRKNYDAIFTRLDTIYQRDRRTARETDGRTDTWRQQSPRLSIASRSKSAALLNRIPVYWLKLNVGKCNVTVTVGLVTCPFISYAPAPRVGGGGIKRRWASDVWRLSVAAYIGTKSRTERHGKTKISTELAHVTCDSDITFKVKRSKVNLQGPGILWRPPAQLVRV